MNDEIRKKIIEAKVYAAAAFCYEKLDQRMRELERLGASKAVLNEVVQSGARTVERFGAYLRTNLNLELEGNEEPWLEK